MQALYPKKINSDSKHQGKEEKILHKIEKTRKSIVICC